MDQFQQLASVLREQMSGTKSRSDILVSLAWAVGLPLSGLLVSVYIKAPNWIQYMLGAYMAIGFGIFSFSYLYCLFRDRDALRSEKYSLTKLAIEHGLIGDNITGVLDITPQQIPQLPSGTQSSMEDEK